MPNMPGEVKIAILLSWVVLAVKASDGFLRIYADPDPSASFRIIWFLVTLTSNAAVGSFIFFASRRKNWARIALLLSTLVAWSLWLIYPQSPHNYSLWKLVLAATLAVCELLTLIFLFRLRATLWYRSA